VLQNRAVDVRRNRIPFVSLKCQNRTPAFKYSVITNPETIPCVLGTWVIRVHTASPSRDCQRTGWCAARNGAVGAGRRAELSSAAVSLCRNDRLRADRNRECEMIPYRAAWFRMAILDLPLRANVMPSGHFPLLPQSIVVVVHTSNHRGLMSLSNAST